MENQKLILELLLSIHRDMGVAKEDISALKTDVKEHIRRTIIAEIKISKLEQNIFRAQGGILLLSLIGTVVAILKYIQ